MPGILPRWSYSMEEEECGKANLSNVATAHPTTAELDGTIIKINYAYLCKINIHGMYTTWHVYSVGADLVDSCEFGTADKRR